MFLGRNKKNNVYPCKPQFYHKKVGFTGVKLYRYVFVMYFPNQNASCRYSDEVPTGGSFDEYPQHARKISTLSFWRNKTYLEVVLDSMHYFLSRSPLPLSLF